MKSVVILLWVLLAMKSVNAANVNGAETQSSEIKETNEFTEVSLEEEPKQAPNPKNYGTYKPRAVNNATDEECVGCCVVQ